MAIIRLKSNKKYTYSVIAAGKPDNRSILLYLAAITGKAYKPAQIQENSALIVKYSRNTKPFRDTTHHPISAALFKTSLKPEKYRINSRRYTANWTKKHKRTRIRPKKPNITI